MEYVGYALFYYESCQDYYSIAHSRFNMVLAMNSVHAFKNSERIIHEILEVEIPDKTKADMIKYYAYINLADIYSQTEQADNALLYLQQAETLKSVLPELEEAYTEMIQIIKARCHFINKNFKECEETLALLPDNLLTNSIPFLNLYVSYLDIQSQLFLETGRTNEALQTSQTLVDYCSTHNYGNVLLNHLYDMIELCESKNIHNAQIDVYRQTIKELSPALVKQRTEDMAIFMKYAYDSFTRSMTNLVYANQLKGNRSVLILVFMISIAIFLIILKKSIDKGRLDGLTGSYNRRHFNYIYDGALINHLPFSIIVMDIDNFKSCNDVFGHEFGDEVLVNVCKCIERYLPSGCQMFRYGGEEFCILCPYFTAKQASEFAETIRKKVSKLTWSKDTSITISLGVADTTSENPFSIADERLYTSKHTGKNKVTWK